MSGMVSLEKACTGCGVTRPFSEFHRNKRSSDGRHHWCKPCTAEYHKKRKAQLRQEMGDDAYRKHTREIAYKSRGKPEVAARQKALRDARSEALRLLVENHRTEFDHLVRVEKYERGLL